MCCGVRNVAVAATADFDLMGTKLVLVRGSCSAVLGTVCVDVMRSAAAAAAARTAAADVGVSISVAAN